MPWPMTWLLLLTLTESLGLRSASAPANINTAAVYINLREPRATQHDRHAGHNGAKFHYQ